MYKFKSGFGGEIGDYVGCLDLFVEPARAKLWNRAEPTYYRLHRKLRATSTTSPGGRRRPPGRLGFRGNLLYTLRP